MSNNTIFTNPYSRRDVLRKGAVLAATTAVLPMVGRVGSAFGLTAADTTTTERHRLVVVFLAGGNDALNTIAPVADAAGTERRGVYDSARPTIALPPGDLLHLDRPEDADQWLGLHPSLSKIHDMYRQGRVGIVQGAGYEPDNKSHFSSQDFWQTGHPYQPSAAGWLGRHLDRVGIGPGEIRGLAMTGELPLALKGTQSSGVNIPGLPFAFRDGIADEATLRHDSMALFGNHPEGEVLQGFYGDQVQATVGLVDQLDDVASPADGLDISRLGRALLDARFLMEGNFGVECVFVAIGGFDTHAGQLSRQADLFTQLDGAVDVFFNGNTALGISPMNPAVADRTLLMTFSEFSRRIGQNASAGTDHGDAVPLFMVGPPPSSTAPVQVVPGLHGLHPDMGTVASPAENLDKTVDFASVYQSVLTDWLADPDDSLPPAMDGLFTTATTTTSTTTTTTTTTASPGDGNGQGHGKGGSK